MTTFNLENGISVVIPFFNEGINTSKSVEAIIEAASQISVPFEIIAVDDGSTDGISKVNLPPETIYIRKPHSGRLQTRLRGLEEAKYEQVLFIDARVRIEKASLKNLQFLIEQNPGTRFWNGYVTLNNPSPFSTIWETLVGVGWKRISPHETTKYGLGDFDRFPKGTGFFLALKSDWIEAFSKVKNSDESSIPISDDTKILRNFAKKDYIWISGRVSASYVGRTSFRSFLKNCFYRGQTFVDSYWDSPTIFGKLVKASFPTGVGLMAVSIFIGGVKGGIFLILGSVEVGAASIFLYSLKTWKSFPRALKESLAAIPLLLLFGTGFARAYVLGFRSRWNS